MKANLSLAIASCIVVALGGCSSSSSSSPSPTTDGGAPDAGDAGTAVDGAPDTGATADADAGTGDNDGATGDDGDDAASAATEFDATLSGAEVVPAVQTTASGTAKFFLQPDGATLTYTITQSVQSATTVTLRMGAPGAAGTVVQQLTPVSASMTGSITLTSDQADALTSDGLYVDIDSTANPGGEVRGQIIEPGAEIFVASATGAQQVPGVNSQYTGTGSFILSADQSTLTYHVTTTAIPTDIDLHRAIAATTGPVSYPITPIGQTSDGTLQLNASDPTDIEAGNFYLNIVTASNPAGELRGQLIKPGETLFSGVLLGSNEVPPVTTSASGGVEFILSPDHTSARYQVLVNSVNATSIDIDEAVAGMTATSPLYPLTLNATGAAGTLNLQPSDVTALTGSGIYVNVHTPSFATGELRTQLVRQ